jgi:hypothetical protein
MRLYLVPLVVNVFAGQAHTTFPQYMPKVCWIQAACLAGDNTFQGKLKLPILPFAVVRYIEILRSLLKDFVGISLVSRLFRQTEGADTNMVSTYFSMN